MYSNSITLTDFYFFKFQSEASPTITTTNDRPQPLSSKGTIPANLQLSLSDQLYRQSKIDEENRRLKKKSKSDGGSSKKGKKKSDAATGGDDNDEDSYPTIKVTRGGELPEGVTESGNEDNDNDEHGGKNKKHDPHRALNIDLDEKSIPIPPVKIQEPVSKPIENLPPITEKSKKIKKKKTSEKEEKSTTSKPKKKRERGDYKELLSPVDDEEKRVVPPPIKTTTVLPSAKTTSEEKPKKKKTKSTEKKASPSPLFDMMSDDINSTNSSNQQYNEQNVYKLVAQSDNLTIVSITKENILKYLI